MPSVAGGKACPRSATSGNVVRGDGRGSLQGRQPNKHAASFYAQSRFLVKGLCPIRSTELRSHGVLRDA